MARLVKSASITHRNMEKMVKRSEHGLGQERIQEQLHIENNDNAGSSPAENFYPKPVGEFAHLRFFTGETDERPHGEAKLHAEHDLAGHKQLGGLAFAKKTNHQHGRHHGDQASDQPAQP